MALFPFFKKKKKVPVYKNHFPKIRSKTVPGPESVKLAAELRRFECPNVTFVSENFPVFLESGKGANLYDADGNRYLDLTSAFGVSGVGHSSPAVLEAIKRQSKLMIHGMGDVHPNRVKVELGKVLSEITPGNLNMSIFSSTGFEAVETALKTAAIHTKKSGVIAFTGAYHGLGYGTLSVTYREDFKKPFLKQLGNFVHTAPFPDARTGGPKAIEDSIKKVKAIIKKNRRSKHPVGAILIEPIQGRGGIQIAPPEFLKQLRSICDEEKILLIADEVFTGFGRTGQMFAIEKSGVVPDIMCLGKGMGGGFPISACIAPSRIMYSWGSSTGDAIHTSTFLGNPLGCAIALDVIKEIQEKKLVDRSRALGEFFRKELWKLKEKYPFIGDIRGSGLMIGMEFSEPAFSPKAKPIPGTAKAKNFMLEALKMGLIVLPSGPDHNVISLTPPFVITEKDITHVSGLFDKILKKIST